MDSEQKTWLERFQKIFAIAVEERWTPEKVDKVIATWPKGEEAEIKLGYLYRDHREKKDNELYGVKLIDVVKVKLTPSQGGLAGRDAGNF